VRFFFQDPDFSAILADLSRLFSAILADLSRLFSANIAEN
jgi:hypothetical protein